MSEICVDYQDVVDYLDTCNSQEVCATQEKIEENIELSIELIESITDTKFCPYEDCKVFEGQGGCYLFWNFGNAEQVYDVQEVTVNGEVVPPTDYEIKSYSIKLLDGKFNCCDKVVVCGTWGSPIPKNIKKAIILLALEYTQPGFSGLQQTDSGVDKVIWSDFSIEYSSPVVDGLTTGFRDIDKLIYSFVPTINSVNFTSITAQCPKCCKKSCKCQ